jgi:hypothetical protein
MSDYKPNERIVDRAVSLWRKMLACPKYDNGDPSVGGFIASTMAAMIPRNVSEERLDGFCVHLKAWLMTPGPRGDFYSKQSLHVDYHPDEGLRSSAALAALTMEFPWKTSMWLYGDHLNVRAGYSAPTIYHYPLTDDRWLVTDLYGSELSKVIEYIDGGQPTFAVEKSQVQSSAQ